MSKIYLKVFDFISAIENDDLNRKLRKSDFIIADILAKIFHIA